MVAMVPGVEPFPIKPTVSIRRMLDLIPNVEQYEVSNEDSDNHPDDPNAGDNQCSRY